MMPSRVREVCEKCDKCIFGMTYTSDGKLTRICSGLYPATTKERHARILKTNETNQCDDYEEGHKRWLEMKESGLGPCRYFCHTPAEQKYKIDREYSDKPVFACGSFREDNCLHGSPDKGCFWKVTGCTSQMRLDDTSRMANPDILRDAFEKAGIDTSEIDYLK